MNPVGLVLVLAGGYALSRAVSWAKRTPHHIIADYARKVGLYVVIALILLLVLTGRLPLLLTLIGAIVAASFRLAQVLPVLRQMCVQLGIPWPPFGMGRTPFGGSNESTVQSRFVRMSLDHRSGELRGEVLEGQFARRWLNDLTLDELMLLLQECRVDQESAALVQSYIERVHGGSSQEQARAQNRGGNRQRNKGRQTAGGMDMDEAWQILGLKPGASRQDILSAHRRLMQKVHPDRGGSDYLAAKLNQAKDTLLSA